MFNLDYMGPDDFIYFGDDPDYPDVVIKPREFRPGREDVYAGEYTTMTGATIADCIGWKFSDLTMTWDALPQSMVDILVNINGPATMTFDAEDGNHTESIIRLSAVSLKNRATINGVTWWRNVSVQVRFLNVH